MYVFGLIFFVIYHPIREQTPTHTTHTTQYVKSHVLARKRACEVNSVDLCLSSKPKKKTRHSEAKIEINRKSCTKEIDNKPSDYSLVSHMVLTAIAAVSHPTSMNPSVTQIALKKQSSSEIELPDGLSSIEKHVSSKSSLLSTAGLTTLTTVYYPFFPSPEK